MTQAPANAMSSVQEPTPATSRARTPASGPRPEAPVAGEPVAGTAVTFSWSAAPDALDYWLQIAADEAFKHVRLNAHTTSSSITLDDALPEEHALLFWRVRQATERGWQPFSEPAAFRRLDAETPAARHRAAAEPGVPVPVTPVLETPVDGSAVPLEWTQVPEATSYHLQVAADGGFEELLFDTSLEPCTSLTLYSLLPEEGSTFFWRVRSEVEAQWRAWSEPASFRAVADAEADAYAMKQETARREAARQRAIQEATRPDDAEAEAPYQSGISSPIDVAVVIVVIVFSFAFTLFLLLSPIGG